MLTQNHVKDGDANTDGEINHDTATFLGFGYHDRLDGRDFVEAAVDTE